MSDEIRSASTDISDDVFNWWKRLVRYNRDRIIITVTHGCLRESGLLATVNRTMTIRRSERFEKVLEEYSVDLWLSGHSHVPHYFPRKWSRPGRFGGTLFLDISAIRKDRWNTVESYFVEFRTMSPEVAIIPRDHVAHRFLEAYGLRHRLRHPFRWDGAPPELVPYSRE
jgi:hypothetical protein